MFSDWIVKGIALGIGFPMGVILWFFGVVIFWAFLTIIWKTAIYREKPIKRKYSDEDIDLGDGL